jgi:hypothetical protein
MVVDRVCTDQWKRQKCEALEKWCKSLSRTRKNNSTTNSLLTQKQANINM